MVHGSESMHSGSDMQPSCRLHSEITQGSPVSQFLIFRLQFPLLSHCCLSHKLSVPQVVPDGTKVQFREQQGSPSSHSSSPSMKPSPHTTGGVGEEVGVNVGVGVAEGEGLIVAANEGVEVAV